MLGQLMWTTTTTALTTGGLTDLWGDPNDVLRYVKASTLKVMAGAWAVVCRRSDVQRVRTSFWRAHSSRAIAMPSPAASRSTGSSTFASAVDSPPRPWPACGSAVAGRQRPCSGRLTWTRPPGSGC